MGKALILIAEDCPETRSLYYWWLTEKGFDVAAAGDGEEALKLLDAIQPDLILTDLRMPKVEGLEVIRQVRSRQALAHVPVVAMTAHRGESLGEAVRAGASEVIDKARGLDHLTEILGRLLRQAA